jgi:integrase
MGVMMGKKAVELGPLQVKRLVEPGLHFVGGVPGLALQVTTAKARSWVLRIRVGARRRDMGLGGLDEKTLAQARELAREARARVKVGTDPIDERKAARSASKAAQLAALTFEQCATQYLAAKSPEWKNAKHAQQWRNTLEQYAYPVIGPLLVRDVELPQIKAVLDPIWTTKTETASRLRGRIESVLNWAAANGYRSGLNPARWRGHLDKLLAKPSKVAKVVHHAAMPLSEVGAFMVKLRAAEGMGARALEFAILTAARSGEVRGATWAEVDTNDAVWIVPAERMKAGREHRVPLSPAAVKLLKVLPRMAGTNLVFPAPRGGVLSDMTLGAVLRRMDVGAVPHGFRSTFRDWCSERTSYPHQIAEMALAHTIGNKVEAAYRRGDLFDKRRKLMSEWATFCARVEPARGAVVPMRRARA